jgi:hypothetical protein
MHGQHFFRGPVEGEMASSTRTPRSGSRRGRRPVSLILSALLLMWTAVATAPSATAASKAKKPAAKSTSKSTGKKSSKKPAIASLSANRAKQAKVRQQRIAASRKVTQLKTADKETAATLAALTDDVKDQNAALGAAKRQVADAEAEVAEAKAQASETRQAIDSLSNVRQQAAIDAYVQPQVQRLNSMLNNRDLAEASQASVYREIGNRGRADTLDELQALEEDNRLALAKAKRAEEKRRARKSAAAKRLKALQASQARTSKYADLVEDQLDHYLSEAESLKNIDAIVSKQVAAQTAAYERQLRIAQRNGVKSAGTGGARLPDIPTGSTNGIVVAASIRGKLAALIAAAARDGVILSGGGYRSSAGQLAVRRRNCGTSSYAVYQMPSSSCRPPTAKPGRSQHERGLAIDFTQNGRALRRSTSGYRWLRANAAKYGFFNLPSEPWHWSTTGR